MNGRKRIIVIMIILFGLLMTTGVSTWIITSQVTFAPTFMSGSAPDISVVDPNPEPAKIKITPKFAGSSIDVSYNELTDGKSYSNLNTAVISKATTVNTETNTSPLSFTDESGNAVALSYGEDKDYTFSIISFNDGTTTTGSSSTAAIGSTYQCTATFTLTADASERYTLAKNQATTIVKYQTCQIGSTWNPDVTATCYTIEDALTTAYGNDVNDTIRTVGDASASAIAQTSFSSLTGYATSYSVKSGDTLLVPYENSSNAYTLDHDANADTVYSVLNIPTSITINLESGSFLTVGAVLSQSGEAENRGVIINNGNINATGATVNSYGYIKGANGNLVLGDGAIATDVFRLYDFNGGSGTLTLNSANVFPMNVYSFHNISCKTTINKDSKYYARYYLYMADTDVSNPVCLVSSSTSDSPLFCISEGYIEKSVEFTNANDNNDEEVRNTLPKTQKEQLAIHGVASDNSISITAKVSLITKTITTNTTMALPLSVMDIIIGSGSNLTLKANSYKIYPGSSITVEKNAKLTVNSGVKVMLYDSASYAEYCSVAKAGLQAPSDDGTNWTVSGDDAYIKNNGEIVFDSGSYVGGNIQTAMDDAMLTLNGNVTCSMPRVTVYNTSSTDAIAGGKSTTVSGTALPVNGELLLLVVGDTATKSSSAVPLNSSTIYKARLNAWTEPTPTVTLKYDDERYSTITEAPQAYGNYKTTLLNDLLMSVNNTAYTADTYAGAKFNGETVTDDYVFYSSQTLNAGFNVTGIIVNFNLNGITPATGLTQSTYTYINTNNYGTQPKADITAETENLTTNNTDKTSQYRFDGWYTDAGCTIVFNVDDAANYDVTENRTTEINLYATWTEKYSFTMNLTDVTATVTYNGSSTPTYTNSTILYFNQGDQITVSINKNYDQWTGCKVEGFTPAETAPADDSTDSPWDLGTITITKNATVTAGSKESSCLVEGTLITLADGSQKKVEDLGFDDEVLIFNHDTGKAEAGKVLFITHKDDEAKEQRILNLLFSDGTVLRIVREHALFDLTLNKYVYINEDNVDEMIGHKYYTTEYDGTEFVRGEITLTGYSITTETVRIFCPVTAYHMDLFAENILTMPNIPNSIGGLFNIFEYDENLKYNEEEKQADIEKYGLYTYEDFKHLMTYEAFISSPAVWLKISIGKGYLTYEEMMYVIEYLLESALIT